jgi:hypothetical protein
MVFRNKQFTFPGSRFRNKNSFLFTTATSISYTMILCAGLCGIVAVMALQKKALVDNLRIK